MFQPYINIKPRGAPQGDRDPLGTIAHQEGTDRSPLWQHLHPSLPSRSSWCASSVFGSQEPVRWTLLSRPIYGQSKLSMKASLKGYCALRTTWLYVLPLLPCCLMASTAPRHGRRLRACDTPTPDGAARYCKTQSNALTLAGPRARCCTPVDTPPRT